MLWYYIIIIYFPLVRLFSNIHDKPGIETNSASQENRDDTTDLNKFRDLVDVGDTLYRDYMKSDQYLSRWLNVTDNNLENAKNALLKTLQWRKDNRIDTIMDEVLMEGKNPPFILNGTDYQGSALALFDIHRWDIRSFILAGKRDEFIRWFTQFMEGLEIFITRRLRLVGNDDHTSMGKATFISDLKHYSLTQHACLRCVGVNVEVLQILEEYYPGYVKRLILINAPRIFKPMLELLKPIMSKQTRNALQVFGVNKSEWEDVLRQIVSMDQLGSMYM